MGTPANPRGTSNKNVTGNAAARRARKQRLLERWGTGAEALCQLAFNDLCEGVVTFETMTVDRIVPGWQGGTYADNNIRPACSPCNTRDGNHQRWHVKAVQS